jgi:hypothetical protein
VDERVAQEVRADLSLIGGVDGNRGRTHGLHFGDCADVVDVGVGEDDLADVIDRTADVVEGAGDDRAGARSTNVDERDIVTIDGEEGAATTSADPVEARRKLLDAAARATREPDAVVGPCAARFAHIHTIERNAEK